LSARAVTARRRDPERRRAEIVEATVGVIAEHGLSSVSHRLIAQRAGVPLGSTTYYFPTLGDLVAEALAVAAESWNDELQRRLSEPIAYDNAPAVLVDLVSGYLVDRARAIVEYELFVAAARDERLRPIARSWTDQIHRLLGSITDPTRARAIAMVLDGAMLRALVLEDPLDRESLELALQALIAPPAQAAPGSGR
jgi:DNA-binding transcriptional regulator YbjK